jgi:hypothetical protein
MDFSSIGLFIGPLITATPFLIAMAVAIVIALVRRQHHPRASMFAVLGFGGFALTSLCTTVLNPLLIMTMNQSGSDISSLSNVMAAVSIGSALINLIWWALIIAAIFADRPKRETL